MGRGRRICNNEVKDGQRDGWGDLWAVCNWGKRPETAEEKKIKWQKNINSIKVESTSHKQGGFFFFKRRFSLPKMHWKNWEKNPNQTLTALLGKCFERKTFSNRYFQKYAFHKFVLSGNYHSTPGKHSTEQSNSGNLRNISKGKDVCSRKLSCSRLLSCNTDFFFPPNTFPKQTLRTSWQSTKHQPSSAQSRFSAEEHQAIHILIVKQMAKALPDLALIIWRFVYLLNMQQCSQKAFPE